MSAEWSRMRRLTEEDFRTGKISQKQYLWMADACKWDQKTLSAKAIEGGGGVESGHAKGEGRRQPTMSPNSNQQGPASPAGSQSRSSALPAPSVRLGGQDRAAGEKDEGQPQDDGMLAVQEQEHAAEKLVEFPDDGIPF